MSEAWKHWEGRVVDGKFALRQYLGGSEHSAVFLTEREATRSGEATQQGEQVQRAAIKFIQVEPSAAELQLSRWKRIAQLAHPHLLRVFESGRCRIGDFNLLYVVMEYASENLAEFLPQRPLTPAETRDVLTPALQALGYLHGQGLVHGRIQPSNILAIDDQLKLSSDSASPIVVPKSEQLGSTLGSAASAMVGNGDPIAEGGAIGSSATLRRPSPYCAPEAVKGTSTPAADIWALGVTLIEALTQRVPTLDHSSKYDPALPEELSALFLDIVRNCLRREPKARWTVAQIQHRLDPTSVPAPAAVVATQIAATPEPAAAASVSAPIRGIPGVTIPVASPAAASHATPVPSGITASLPTPVIPPPPVAPPASLTQSLALGSLTPPSSPSQAISQPDATPSAAATAPARIAPPAPSKPAAKPAPLSTQPYHIPAARPPMPSASRGDAKHHDISLPKLKQPPLLPKANYFLLGLVLGLIVIGFIGLKLFGHRTPVAQQGPHQQTASTTPQTSAPQKSAPPTSKSKQQPAKPTKGATTSTATTAASQPLASAPASTQVPAIPSAKQSASSRDAALSAARVPPTPATPVATNISATSGHVVHGEVLNQVLPAVSDKARSTIWGTVRVGVRVHVDTAGNVVAAQLNAPGPSKFFADKALEAARNWDFVPAKLDGHNVASDWLIRFQFSQSGTRVFPAEETP